MPGPNDPICTLMTIKGCYVTMIIDPGASHSFMDSSIIDLVHAKTKQANYTVKLEHHETITTCASEMEPLATGFGKCRFHYIFSTRCLAWALLTSLSITLRNHYPAPRITTSQHQHQHLVNAVKEHICKHILETIKKYRQENKALPTGPFCTLPEAILHLDTRDHPLVFRHQYSILHHIMIIIDLQVAECPWNSSLIIIPKKDADGNITQWHCKASSSLLHLHLTSFGLICNSPKDCINFT
ncbi:hypothetical protein QOT17_025387 [Balamuthia mandrillaris]